MAASGARRSSCANSRAKDQLHGKAARREIGTDARGETVGSCAAGRFRHGECVVMGRSPDGSLGMRPKPATDTVTSRLPLEAGKLRVLIADDHAVLREGVALLIDREDDMCVIAQAK